jgi:hypothetical protein
VLPELVKRDIGVLGMKSMANGVILKSGVVTAIEDRAYRSRSASSTGSTRTMFSVCTAVRVDVTSTQPKAR